MLIIFSTLIFMSLKLGCERAVRRTWLRRNDDSHNEIPYLRIWPRSYSLKSHLHCCVFRALFHPAVEQDQHKVSPSLKRPQFYIFCLQFELEWLREIQKLPNDLTSFSLSWAIFTIIGLSLVASNTLSLSEVEYLLVLDMYTVLSEMIIHFTCLI